MKNDNTISDIMLSVCMVTYNHEQFIEQAINGVLAQKVSFRIELVIGEDCSTDSTRKICIDYQKQYPDIITLNLPDKNIGAQQNFVNTCSMCKGKYVALCEGDDYWIDENKLQKQVDFLERNPDYSLSSHNSVILAHNGKLLYDPPLAGTTYTTADIISLDWGIMTASIVFRRSSFTIPAWFKNVRNGDYALQLLVSAKGMVNYIPEYMSVYRRHLGGVSIGFRPLASTNSMYYLLDSFNKETGGRFKKQIGNKMQFLYKKFIQTAKENKLRRQYLGLCLAYCFSKLRINILPIISKISFFSEK